MSTKRFCSMVRFSTLMALCVLMAAPATAADNPKVNMNTFRPSPHPGDILGIYTASQPKSMEWGAGLWMTYNYRPLRLVDQNGLKLYNAIDHQLFADVQASLNLFGFLNIGLDLPVALWSAGEKPITGVNLKEAKSASLSDIRLGLKATLLNHKQGKGFGIALAEDVSFPTATARNFTGDEGVTSSTYLVFDYMKRGWQFALNGGYRARKNVQISLTNVTDELLLGAGLVVPLICSKLEVIGTAESRTAISDPWGNKYKDALDLMGGVRLRMNNLSIMAAAGSGMMKGFGSPKVRGTINASWEPTIDRGCCKDPDKDGVCEPFDKCPNVAGKAALAGCPDRDNDGIIDSEDRCPDNAGPAEFKGCPDRDKDGIVDIDDECPDVPGLKEFKGCPDTDKDGIQDKMDKCPNDPGPKEFDGCPDRDNDGIIDLDDKCPDVPGVKEYAGCPPPRVEVTKEKVVIREMVFFEFNKAIIKEESFGLLKEVAKVLNENKQLTMVRIDGHTDNVGKRPFNMKLSQKRAEAVMKFLVKESVDKTRLSAKGFADTVSIADNATDEGRAKNRRVEFTIITRTEEPK